MIELHCFVAYFLKVCCSFFCKFLAISLQDLCDKSAGQSWTACKAIVEIGTPNLIENHEKYIQNLVKNLEKWCLGALLRATLEAGLNLLVAEIPSRLIFLGFWRHWVDFCRFWGPLRIQGGATTVKQIEYGDVWAPLGGQKGEKNGF